MAVTNVEFYIVVPKEAMNLITNPSFELGTGGYTVTNGVGSQVSTAQRRGVFCMKNIPSSGVASVISTQIALTNGVQYTFSCDVLDVAGQAFSLVVNDNSPAQIATTAWTGDGQWKRKSVTFTANANTPFALTLRRASVASVTPFYTDGWQLEAGSASSYFDGDMVGFVRNQVDFYWTGTPHASTSFRSGQTRRGGTELRIKDYASILTVLGLGFAPIINNALPNVRGGGFYQNSVFDSRTVSLNLALTGTTPGAIMTNRKALMAAVNPKLTGVDQPMILRVRGLDASGNEQTDTVDAYVQYSGGLEGTWDTPGLERAPLQFQMFLPYLVSDGEAAQQMTINVSVANANTIVMKGADGTWSALGTGATGGVVTTLAVGPDGAIYAGGTFTQMGGVANTARIAKWNGSSWSALGTGMNGAVNCMVFGPDGTLYVGGNFTLAGGVANTVYIAKWNGSAWSALSTGMTVGGVYALAVGLDGTLYATGDFATASGVASTAYIAKWSGSAWSSMGSFGGGGGRALAVGLDGSIYAGGAFTSAGGVANTAFAARWNGITWVSMGTWIVGAVYALAVGPDGLIYAGGAFSPYAARWNGSSWSALGSGMDGTVYGLSFDRSGNLYVVGGFGTAGGVTLIDKAAMWTGGSWVHVDLSSSGGAVFNAVLVDRMQNVFFGITPTGAVTTGKVTGVTNTGSDKVYPKILFSGAGSVFHIKNTTTGKAIYFGLVMNAGESAVLDLNPDNPTFISSMRGNVMSAILPGSNMDLALLPGANNISVFLAGATTCSIVWPNYYESFDGAVR